MGGSKGGSGGSGAYDYYGTIAGMVCQGPVDYLVSVIVDGKDVWPGAAAWASGASIAINELRQFGAKTWRCTLAHTSSTLNQPPNPTYWTEYSLNRGVSDSSNVTLVNYGTMTIYWGTQTQTQDALLASAGNNLSEDHPAYTGMCYVVLRDTLFGRERTSAPNIEVVVRKKTGQTLLTGSPLSLIDDQTNPVVDLITAATEPINGVGIATAQIDTTSWQTAADAVYAQNTLSYVSALLDSQTTLRDFATDMALVSDAFVRFNASTQKVEAGFWKHGTAPVSFTTLTIDDIADGNMPEFANGAWKDANTGAVVVFMDRERAYKQSSDKVDDLRAVRVVGENRRVNLQRPYITRRDQALAHAAETLRTVGRPQLDGTLVVRREKARSIQVGDWVRFDIDIEPGGPQLLQYFRVSEKSIPYRGPITLKLDADETLTPIPYTPPAGTPGVLPTLNPPALSVFRFFSPPHQLSQRSGEWVCLLAQRPDPMVIGVHISFDSTYVSPQWDTIGDLDTFGVYGNLNTAYSDTATGAVLVDFANQLDISRLSQSITPSQATDDAILLILLKKDATQISNDALGFAEVEIMSVSAISLVSGTTYSLTTTRARQGTKQRSFPITGDGTEAWLINREALRYFSHAGLEVIAKNATENDPILNYTGFFLLQTFNPFAMLPAAGLSAWGFNFPKFRSGAPKLTWAIPDLTAAPWSGNKKAVYATTPQTLQFQGTWEDLDGDIVAVSLSTRKPGFDEVVVVDKNIGFAANAFFDYTASFTTGEYEIVARCRDSAGFFGEDVLQFTVNASPTTTLTPYFKTIAGNRWGNSIPTGQRQNTKIYCDSPTPTIEFAFGAYGAASPSSIWRTYGTQTVHALAQSYFAYPFRIFIRATASPSTLSATNYADCAGLHD